MPVDVREVYQQAFEAHRHASDFRAKIIGGWAAVFTAFAAIFVWAQANHLERMWVVALAGLLLNLMMWLADHRNRPAIGRAKNIGKAIEEDQVNGVIDEWRFFSKLDKGVSHSCIIDIFGLISSGLFMVAVWALW